MRIPPGLVDAVSTPITPLQFIMCHPLRIFHMGRYIYSSSHAGMMHMATRMNLLWYEKAVTDQAGGVHWIAAQTIGGL